MTGNNNKLCSIVVPAYNRADLIAETLKSLINQTYRPLEIVVVDDASTDNTVEVVESMQDYAKDHGVDLHLFLLPENGGVAVALNEGIRKANGAYIGLTGSDDLWKPQCAEKMIAVFEQDPEVGLCYTDAARVDVDGNRISDKSRFVENGLGPERGDIFEKLLLKGHFIPAICSMVSRKVADKLAAEGGFNVDYVHTCDYDYYIRAAAYSKVDYVDEVLAYWRMHNNNLHQQRKTITYTERAECFLANYEKFKDQYNIPKWKVLIPVSNSYAQAGRCDFLQGEKHTARGYFLQGIRTLPLNPVNYLFWLNSWLNISLLWDFQWMKKIYVKLFFRKST